MRTIVNGTRIWFDFDGAGLVPDGPAMRQRPTLVLLHGGPGFDHSSFKPAHSTLSDVAQILYVDHRGNGRSDYGDPSSWTLDQWADDLRALFDRLGIERPVVLGLSFGGFVAQALALRHPDHVGRLVLSSTAAKFRLDRCLDTFLRLHGTRARAVAEAFWTDPGHAEKARAYIAECFPLYNPTPRSTDADRRSTFNPAMLHHFFRADGEGFRFDFRDRLKFVRCPTLVLAGDLDPVTPIADADDIAAALPSTLVQYERFVGAGHGVGRDQPERYFAILRDVIAAAPLEPPTRAGRVRGTGGPWSIRRQIDDRARPARRGRGCRPVPPRRWRGDCHRILHGVPRALIRSHPCSNGCPRPPATGNCGSAIRCDRPSNPAACWPSHTGAPSWRKGRSAPPILRPARR